MENSHMTQYDLYHVKMVMPRRHLWYWVNFVFNRVDPSRVKAVGPDRAAAEWALRLGGRVKFVDFENWSTDYNYLPSSSKLRYLESINNTGVAVTNNGLEHLEGLMHLQSLSLSKCNYLDNDGLALLSLVQQSLLQLDVSYSCNLTAKCLQYILPLKKLRILNLSGIKVSEEELQHVYNSLPNCKIIV